MAIQGDLKDMSVMNVMQFIYQDGRNTALFLTRESEDGVIYFDRGEPVHATLGSLDGEEAVYQLLSWTEGTFRVSEYATIPRQTIHSSWNDLVLEGMRRADERGRAAAVEVESHKALTQAEIEQDSDLENAVILLLSWLEQSRTQLLEKGIQRQPAQALRILAEMVNRISAFAESKLYVDILAEALACEADGLPGARLLQVENNRLSVRIATRQGNWGGDHASREEMLRQAGGCMIGVLRRYTSLIANSFRSSSMVDQWSVTCDGFIADLGEAAKGIQF